MPATTAVRGSIAQFDYRARALAIWPGIDAQKLRRTNGDPLRIARLVERRTRLPIESIVSLLTGERADRDEDVAGG